MIIPTTIKEAVDFLVARNKKLRRNITALAQKINSYIYVSGYQDVTVNRDAGDVLKETDMKDRAIQLVKDLGSNKTNEEIWAILQTLPSKQVNATAKAYILGGVDAAEKRARHLAWTEILAVREEAEVFSESTGVPFSSDVFAQATQTTTVETTALWTDTYNSGQPVTVEEVQAAI